MCKITNWRETQEEINEAILIVWFVSSDLETTRINIENALDVELIKHDSSYHGGDYYLYENLDNDVEIYLEYNRDLLYNPKYDPIKAFWSEPDFCDYQLLLYFDAVHNEIEETFQKRLDQVVGIHFLKLR